MSSARSEMEQKRATFAYQCAYKAKDDEKNRKKYKAYAKKIPVLIKTNGLGQTLAFIKSKTKSESDKAWNILYEDINNWLKSDPKALLELKDGEDLVQKVVSLESPQYRAVTGEVLAFMNWLRRFADGLIEGEDEDEN